ncbi:glutamine--fructose-6-phosphate transaminase (isomerizing) [Thalassoroseus pseudoceratinae]|uniref:glutamine--fructose-6-phosphate transaminase (isomerizing) n=1 Tax=Thalassoroseus pseudoceratinae TaxID=2713176 RepID=UPI00142316F8|nr:glutamine--fructose-6-phosphate transaminase (isomerizing) [Thalassoroseus pseudoceratinae]
MCGIVGYLGATNASDVLLTGLKRLEYRGYDSAGLATIHDGQLHVRRAVGPVDQLQESLTKSPVRGEIGIGHTRWATHGQPSEQNAHPHMDASGRIALVHNGVIENHSSIRNFLADEGIQFHSQTDTECLVQLIGFFYGRSGDLRESLELALQEVRGTFGIALVCSDHPETLFSARRGSPLLVGITAEGYVIASDPHAVVAHTSDVTYLEDDEVAVLSPAGLEATTIHSVAVEKRIEVLDLSLADVGLSGHANYMEKEIREQPESLREMMRGRLDVTNGRIVLGGLTEIERDLAHFQRVLLFGCGTAWHAALIGGYLFETLAGIPTTVQYASELRYRNPLIEENTLAVAMSQSGETADTLAALREVKLKGATCLGIVNTVGSSIALETDAGVYLHVGPEIGVASTKAFTAQVAVLTMMACDLGRRRRLSPEQTANVVHELATMPEKIAEALETEKQIQSLVADLSQHDNWLYLGRGVNFPVALEGALKLKEISYIHAEGLPAAEMKHGPIALIDKGMPVVVIAVQDHTYEKVLSNIEEVRSRKGRVIAIATQGDTQIGEVADEVIFVPPTIPALSPLVTTIPLQWLAYHTALHRGCNVDKPRNLAKSVTVE